QTGAVIWSPAKMDELLGAGGAALECATEGSRVAFAIPAAELPEGMADQAGLDAHGSLVGSLDIQAVLLPKAEGRDVFNDARGLPSVVREPDGQPGIIIPDTSAPKKVVTQTLIAGNGAKVGDSAVADLRPVPGDERLRDDLLRCTGVGDDDAGLTVGLPDNARQSTCVIEDIAALGFGEQHRLDIEGAHQAAVRIQSGLVGHALGKFGSGDGECDARPLGGAFERSAAGPEQLIHLRRRPDHRAGL